MLRLDAGRGEAKELYDGVVVRQCLISNPDIVATMRARGNEAIREVLLWMGAISIASLVGTIAGWFMGWAAHTSWVGTVCDFLAFYAVFRFLLDRAHEPWD